MLQMTSTVHPIPILATALCRRSPSLAIVDCARGYNLTYRELADSIDFLGAQLMASGAAPGSTIAISYRGSLPTMIGILAAWQAGMVPIPFSKLPAPDEQLRIFSQCLTKIVLSDVVSASEIADIRIVSRELVVAGETHVITTLQDIATTEVSLNPAERDKLALIVYTSGTTGSAKGVMLGTKSIDFAVNSMADVVGAQPGDRALVPLPFGHLYGIVAFSYILATGGTVYVSDSQLLGSDFIGQIVFHKINAILFQPQHVKLVLGALADASFPQIRYVACGSGSVSMSEAKRIGLCFPSARQFFYYALSEAPRAVYVADAHLSPTAEIPLGHPAAGMRLHLDGAGETTKNLLGEIVISGPAVAMGYIGDVSTTGEKFSGDSFRTGDLGEELSGEIYYRGRVADLVAWNGTYCSPWETEAHLTQALGEDRAVIVGLGTTGAAEAPILRAIVEGSLTPIERDKAEAIVAPLAAQLNLVLKVEAHASFPRNATGKVLRQKVLQVSGY